MGVSICINAQMGCAKGPCTPLPRCQQAYLRRNNMLFNPSYTYTYIYNTSTYIQFLNPSYLLCLSLAIRPFFVRGTATPPHTHKTTTRRVPFIDLNTRRDTKQQTHLDHTALSVDNHFVFGPLMQRSRKLRRPVLLQWLTCCHCRATFIPSTRAHTHTHRHRRIHRHARPHNHWTSEPTHGPSSIGRFEHGWHFLKTGCVLPPASSHHIPCLSTPLPSSLQLPWLSLAVPEIGKPLKATNSRSRVSTSLAPGVETTSL